MSEENKVLCKILFLYGFVTILSAAVVICSVNKSIEEHTNKVVSEVLKDSQILYEEIGIHSVHPTYGNFTEVSYVKRCSPVDSCE